MLECSPPLPLLEREGGRGGENLETPKRVEKTRFQKTRVFQDSSRFEISAPLRGEFGGEGGGNLETLKRVVKNS